MEFFGGRGGRRRGKEIREETGFEVEADCEERNERICYGNIMFETARDVSAKERFNLWCIWLQSADILSRM